MECHLDESGEIGMKATALVAAAALVCGTAALAQQDTKARGEESARVEQQEHGTAGEKMRSGMHRLGEKTRNALHHMGDKLHARRDHADNTRAMGASGSTVADTSSARQQRMDEAYGHWKAQQEKSR
jgi:hypothetical protein